MQTTLNQASANTTAWLAIATGAVQLIGFVSLLVFFAIGGPFGTINDAAIALTGLLSAALAWQLFGIFAGQPAVAGRLALALAGFGALIVVAGSALIIFDITGFVLAGFYCELGNALIGLWLLALCFAAQGGAGWPR